jgi:hypothetical protein
VVSCWLGWSDGVGWLVGQRSWPTGDGQSEGVVGWSEKLDGKVSCGQCPAVVDGVVVGSVGS